jgi:hypothetical protein
MDGDGQKGEGKKRIINLKNKDALLLPLHFHISKQAHIWT